MFDNLTTLHATQEKQARKALQVEIEKLCLKNPTNHRVLLVGDDNLAPEFERIQNIGGECEFTKTICLSGYDWKIGCHYTAD